VPLAQLGYRVFGIDIAPRMIADAAREHPSIRFALMSATDLALGAASMDHVFFSANGIDCIFPADRRDQALREIHRVLKPGGWLLYSAHNWVAQAVTSLRNPTRREHFLANVRRGRVGPGYLTVPQAEGELVLYYGWPVSEVRRLRRLGFRDVRVHSGKISPRLDRLGGLSRTLFDAWPYYAARR
jgi:SAM-dependent methyltransferase